MLVERGIQVMNFEVVGDAYAIASNYLRKTGAIADTFATDERLLEIIVKMIQHGEFNRTPARQQGDRRIRSAYTGLNRITRITQLRRNPWKPRSTVSCTPMICL